MNADERIQVIAHRKKRAERDGKERYHSVFCNGAWREFEVWTVPAEALMLNADNKRFAAAKTLVEEELGHPLDPENNSADEESIVSILLDRGWKVDGDRVRGTPGKDYFALKDDWAQRKQAEPLWIRPDGTVRNGNRRLAMLRRIRQEGGATAGDWVDVIVLGPEDIDELELFRMEQAEQLAENFKVRYTNIDLLLALREAAEHENIDWADPESIDRVAGVLKHYAGRDDKRYAAVQLRAIRAIDAYLEYLGHPGEYHFVMQERLVEVFRDVGKIMQLGDEYPDDIMDLIQTAFAAVQSQMSYQEIRQLRKLFIEDREEFLRVAERIRGSEDRHGWPPSGVGTVNEIDAADTETLTAEDDEEDELGDPPPSVSSAAYPKAEVRRHLDRAIDSLAASGLETQAALQQVANRLQQLDSSDVSTALEAAGSSHVLEALTTIALWVEENQEFLDRALHSTPQS